MFRTQTTTSYFIKCDKCNTEVPRHEADDSLWSSVDAGGVRYCEKSTPEDLSRIELCPSCGPEAWKALGL